ncbi:MAG TPA: ATP-binding cassette domain-containing protein [Vicinamibacterales bacterium]|jgi:ABC-type polar amino acid transport system ATPase subunit|nr:ATP-binding cassette domain-containing protein [Vicinamibacterales bacterium]
MSALAVRDLQVVRGGRMVVEGVSFDAQPGELLALMGASGSGKTTVLRAIAGLEPVAGGSIELGPPDAGSVRLGPGPLPRGAALRALHARVGMVFQFHNLFAHLTAVHNVSLAPVHVRGEARDAAERTARRLLEELGVGGRAEARPHELSGGEAQRVAIARALAMNPPVLLLDEPTASLDPERRADLARTVRTLVEGGRTVLAATHDADFVRGCADRVLLLQAGRIASE